MRLLSQLAIDNLRISIKPQKCETCDASNSNQICTNMIHQYSLSYTRITEILFIAGYAEQVIVSSYVLGSRYSLVNGLSTAYPG